MVVQNNGKEMYIKSVQHVQSCFLLIRPIVFLFVCVFVLPFSLSSHHYTILYFV